MAKEFKPSKYNKNIFKFIINGVGNAVIAAVAGSGKTTTLIKSLELIPLDKEILVIAFNKAIANELTERVPKTKNITVKTVHGLGYSLLRNYNPNVLINDNKYRQLFYAIHQYLKTKDQNIIAKYEVKNSDFASFKKIPNDVIISVYANTVLALCDIGRQHNIDFVIKQNAVDLLIDLAVKHSLSYDNNEHLVALDLIKIGIKYYDEIDFTDMIFLPNVLNLDCEKYDFVFIDECQDINVCQRLLMLKAIKENTGRFIALGDPAQAIYGFAGSDIESYEKLCKLPNTIQLPLSISYRCAEPIVKFVNRLNKEIKANPNNKDGKIIGDYSYKDINDGDMVLCRQTFPVVSLCIKYISQGKKAYVIGSDIGVSLVRLINNSNKKNNVDFTMDDVISFQISEMEKMIKKIVENRLITPNEAKQTSQIILHKEKIQVLEILSNDGSTPEEVIKKIENIFSNKNKEGICLSNIHKSKGLEAENVFIIHQDLMPSKLAKLPWEKQQENNLMYVAFTRAKRTLGFISDFDAWDKENYHEKQRKELKISKHLGEIGLRYYFTLTVVEKRNITTKFGETVVYDLIDKDNNMVTKFGEIPNKYNTTFNQISVEKGSNVSFYAIIKDHTVFRGNNITNIGKLMEY
jgi:DNA helicase-2/ATP-dependent DNA helicase PcrA